MRRKKKKEDKNTHVNYFRKESHVAVFYFYFYFYLCPCFDVWLTFC